MYVSASYDYSHNLTGNIVFADMFSASRALSGMIIDNESHDENNMDNTTFGYEPRNAKGWQGRPIIMRYLLIGNNQLTNY